MISTPVKRSAPPFDADSRPSKRQATSSPEEGELDDATPPPAPRSPTPAKGNKPLTKVPFPFKKKSGAQDPKPESLQNGRGQPGGFGRSLEDDRRFRGDDRWPPPARPPRLDQRTLPPRTGDHWSRQDDGPPRPRRDERRHDEDRVFYPRGEVDRWEPRDEGLHSPRRYDRRDSTRSRSRSSGRSRSPLSPESTGKEKHRLPPPRSPILDSIPSFSRSLYDDRDSRDRRYNNETRPMWEGSSYTAEDGHRSRDSRGGWRRDEEHGRRPEGERTTNGSRSITGESYRPVSPRLSDTPHRPPSSKSPPPKSSKLQSSIQSPPPPPPPNLAPPPSPPRQVASAILPTNHASVKIPLPKKPSTPTKPSSPTHRSTILEDSRRPIIEKPKENGQVRPPLRREKRKPVKRTRSEELTAYGRVFEGCGSKEDYDITTKLGEGTFGEVHKARHVIKGTAVALKRILMHNEKEGMPVTALREIKILKSLHHSCIVDIVDMFVVKSRGKESPLSVYMVFPYMDHDLAGLLENERVKFSPSQIKLYMKQLLEGTEYMHRNHILHRDMKAANLLISNNGSLKIADFGLARAFDPNIVRGEEGRGRERRYTNCVVTRWYRPPELLLGARQYGGEVDMWGIGCVLGEMFWRKPILPGSSDLDQLDKIWQLCGTPNQHTWPNYDLLPGCEGVKRFTFYPRRLKQTYETIGAETCDLLDKLLTCNPRERLTASQALDHDYFWTDPLPADPKTLPAYEASHEFDKRGRRHQQPAGPPVQPPHIEQPSRPIPAPTQPPPPRYRPPQPSRESFRNGPPLHGVPHPSLPPFSLSLQPHHQPPPPSVLPPPPPPIQFVPQTLPPLSLRPGQGLPPQFSIPLVLPDHLPPRPMPMVTRGGRVEYHRGRERDGQGGGAGLNYG